MNRKVIINITFNTYQFNDDLRLSKEWIEYRINIFMNYTLKSLINQTCQDFTTIFHYDLRTKDIIYDELSKYPPLPKNIILSSDGYSLLKELIAGYEYLYLVRIDSDDMYHPLFIQKLLDLNLNHDTECILNQDGYAYDCIDNKLGIWYAQSPPFYTLIYKVQDYLNGFRYKVIGGHKGVIDLNYQKLLDKNYLVLIHGKNNSTKFSYCTKGELSEATKLDILKEFKLI